MNVPNMITIARFFLIPIFILVFFSGHELANLYAFVILLVAGLSDMLDGYLARKHGLMTEIGKLLDPLADKCMMITVICSFLIDQRISMIAAGFFFFRDIAMILISAVFHFRNSRILASNFFGKASTVFYYVVFLFLMFQFPYSEALLWAAIIFSFITSFVYLIHFVKAHDELKRASQ
ncbi:CDP-alcohol phosphatidyltransferase family protein [Caldalkalibacillus salinus]|uniref:CDP-alcohol phosphatidyltransferase family protein n=1 Tax=Caldalkalibacillus salinus TaxID=2803787 RepID=UPI001923E59C|nr:CDP-alcohol phosphatidyltransferase family protein [Caldalkalibacillus salinus]